MSNNISHKHISKLLNDISIELAVTVDDFEDSISNERYRRLVDLANEAYVLGKELKKIANKKSLDYNDPQNNGAENV